MHRCRCRSGTPGERVYVLVRVGGGGEREGRREEGREGGREGGREIEGGEGEGERERWREGEMRGNGARALERDLTRHNIIAIAAFDSAEGLRRVCELRLHI